MHSFELKTPINAAASRIFDCLTDPRLTEKWEHYRWALNDMRVAGKVRKRDEDSRLWEGEIVLFDRPNRYGLLWPVPNDAEDPDEGLFQVRMEFQIESLGDNAMLTLKCEGFPTEELATREKNSWGGFFLEKLRKVAEAGGAFPHFVGEQEGGKRA